jgi:putative intracellular protease/amidase
MAVVLIPVPGRDGDPTEIAVTWQVLTELGHEVVFASPDGAEAACDEVMLTGRGLDPWGWVPGLDRIVAVGRPLRANADAVAAHAAMLRSPAWRKPVSWADASCDGAGALMLPGGHRARGMRPYMESEVLHALVVDAFRRDLPVGAICHGVLLAARSVDPRTGQSVLHGRRTTALTWALERTAWNITRVTRFWDRDYYRTYRERAGQPAGYMSVQAEVTRALADPADFADVDPGSAGAKRRSGGRVRDRDGDASAAFVVRDGNYVSARWPGDAFTFAATLAALL